tara:strand:- start:4869 stop:7283 length:2415 start_codon:yes stop_codon:yes gene_type:complete
MKISNQWIKDYLEFDLNVDETSEILTNLGLEVEGVETYESVKGGFEGLVVGHVLSCKQHPNADRLKVTRVDIGEDEILQIVCGAPNIAQNQKVVVAMVNATLHTNSGESFKIKKSKIRGEISQGMICAEDEIGLGENHDGILILESSLEPGTPCSEIFDIVKDNIYEIGLTPNRCDAMSHYGVARDLRAYLEVKGHENNFNLPSTNKFHVEKREHSVEIDVLNAAAAPRYCGIVISDCKVSESPNWLKNRLKAIGLKPINNIVDITNYVLHSIGQPLHAFDFNKIKGQKVVVRNAVENEKFVTLDGVERKLSAEDLIICDAEKPMCLAGIFGGEHSGVTQKTTIIFLESAFFDPVNTRKSAKRHGLSTDASFRFERGIDIELTEHALKKAAILIEEIAGGIISSELQDLFPKKFEAPKFFMSFDKLNKIAGVQIPEKDIQQILTALEIKVLSVNEAGYGLSIPLYRWDVTRDIDVIEEVLRVYGYHNIPVAQKLNSSLVHHTNQGNLAFQDKTASFLSSLGFYEIMTNSLIAAKHNLNNEKVSILNPLSQDLSAMRDNLIHSGLQVINHNVNRQQQSLKLYEFGKTYIFNNEQYIEKNQLCIYLSGQKQKAHWAVASEENSGFFDIKGLTITLFERFGINIGETYTIQNEVFQYGLECKYKNQKIAQIGCLSSKILTQNNTSQQVYAAIIEWDYFCEMASQYEKPKFNELNKFPKVKRDLALLIDNSLRFDQLQEVARQAASKLLKEVYLFDVYEGKELPVGKKSYALSFILEDRHKTLTDKQIDHTMGKITKALVDAFNVELR